MKTKTLLIFVFAGLAAGPGIGQAGVVTFYDDINDFLSATQSLDMAFEDFETGFTLTNSEHWSACVEPVSNQSNDACFAPGDLAPGFTVTSQENLGGVLRMAPDVWDAGSHVVGAWPFQTAPSSFNPTVVSFEHGPTAVAADVYGVRLAPGVPTGDPEPVLVQVFDRDDVLLDEILVEPPAYDSPVFTGVVSTEPVGRVVYATQLDSNSEHAGEMIDNLHFGGGAGRLDIETVDFGPRHVDSAATTAVTLTNQGDLDLDLGSIPAPAAPFSVASDACSGQSLAPGEDCVLELGFQPAYVGMFSQMLMIPAAAPSELSELTVTGRGIRPRIDTGPARLDFGQVTVGATSTPLAVTVGNSTAAPLELTSMGAGDSAFAITGGSCGAVPVELSSGATCTLEIIFNPGHPGRVDGAAVLIAAGQAGSASIALQGEGVQP